MSAGSWIRSVVRGRRRTAVEEYYAQLDIAVLREQLTEARDRESSDVPLSLLLTAATLRTGQLPVSKEKRRLGHEFYDPLVRKWKQKHATGTISASPPHAMIVLHRGDRPSFNIAMSPVAAPDFDWSVARNLLNRVDEVTELAKAWIPDTQAQIPHMERAYALATQVLAAVQRERWRRQALHVSASDRPTDAFDRELSGVEPQVKTAEQLFALSATQNAQSNYINGMLLGACILSLFCGAGGALLYAFEQPAVIGVAFAAGALGAVISVLQRLTSGSLDLDFREPGRRVRFFGAVRPWIGAIFGMVLFALLQSGLLGIDVNAPEGTGPELAYFGILGFFAGFNERFAQDVVSTSASGLGATFSATQAGTASTS